MEEEIDLDALAEELRLTPDVLQGAEMPAILANCRDGELVEVGVGGQKWARVASYANLEHICTAQAAALQGFRLGVYVMPYLPAGDAEPLRSGICHGVAYRVLNPAILDTKMVAAHGLARGELPSLDEAVQTAIDEMSELGFTVDESPPPPPSYSADERKLANLRYVRALVDEGVDPHDTIVRIDPKLHKEIYSQDGAYDPCKPDLDSEARRNLTVASLHELIQGVQAADRKSEAGMILELEGTIDSDYMSAIGSKLARLLHSYQDRLRDHACKVEALGSTPSLIGCGVPSK